MERIYTKCSIERAPRYAIITDIVREEDGTLYVQKRPYTEEAKAHVSNMPEIYRRSAAIYEGDRFSYILCEPVEDGVRFEYAEGKTLEEIADSHIADGHVEQALACIDEVIRWMYQYADRQTGIVDDNFRAVFGEADIPDDTLCARLGNIDLILPNIIAGDGFGIIDYEWTFDFAIPVKFIVYRMLYDYIYGNESRLAVLAPYRLFEKYEISHEEAAMFAAMENSFQTYIKGGIPSLRDMGNSVMKENVPINGAVEHELEKIRHNLTEIYMDCGEGYQIALSEQCKEPAACEGLRVFDISIPHNARGVIVFPAKKDCIVKVEKCVCENDMPCRVVFCEGVVELGPGLYALRQGQIQFEVILPLGMAHLHLELQVWYMNDTLLQNIVQDREGLNSEVRQEHAAWEEQRKQTEELTRRLNGEQMKNLVLAEEIKKLRG